MKFIYFLFLPFFSILAAGCAPAGQSAASGAYFQTEMTQIKNGLTLTAFIHKEVNHLKQEISRGWSGEAGFEDYIARGRNKLKREPGGVLTDKPANGRLTSAFGPRKLVFEKRARRHSGIDLAAPKGTPIRASGAGQVVSAGWRGAYGRVVEIDHNEGLTTLYAHMDKYTVKLGQTVVAGQAIGTVGNTGRSTGPHLHFETRINKIPVDPLKFVKWA